MEHIAHSLDTLLSTGALGDAMAARRVLECWDQMVGEAVARRTRPVQCRDGRLVVEVENSAWLHQLSFQTRLMTRKINQHVGRETVKSIHLVLAGGRRTTD